MDSIRMWLPSKCGFYSNVASIQVRLLFEGSLHSTVVLSKLIWYTKLYLHDDKNRLFASINLIYNGNEATPPPATLPCVTTAQDFSATGWAYSVM